MADSTCPYCKDYYCLAEPVLIDIDGWECYSLCNSDNHETCPRFLRHKKLTDRLESEKEASGAEE